MVTKEQIGESNLLPRDHLLQYLGPELKSDCQGKVRSWEER
jgi:hypothetical protein